MKSLLLFALCSLPMVMLAQLNEEIVIQASNKISKNLTPKQVIDSLKKRFPDAKAVQYYKTPPEAVARGWVVTEEDNMASGDVLDNYTISFKRDDFQYYALYDANGKLLMSKYQELDAKLPEPVRASLLKLGAEEYPDYRLSSKEYFHKFNYDKEKEYYEIKAVNKTNKKDKKTVLVAPDGTILKVKG